MMMYKNKRILISGGTGSWGAELTKQLLEFHNPKEIIINSIGLQRILAGLTDCNNKKPGIKKKRIKANDLITKFPTKPAIIIEIKSTIKLKNL